MCDGFLKCNPCDIFAIRAKHNNNKGKDIRSGTPKTKKSKKKDRGTVVEVMRSPSVELTGQQGMQWLMHMLNNNVLPQPRRVRKENMEVEGAAIVNDIFHSMTSVIYGDQETDANNRLAENGEAPAARSLTHMSDAYHNIVSDQSTNRPTLLKEPEPSPQAQELIQALKKMLKLEENIKLSVTLATASCDELIKIPLNLPQTEIFLLFLRNHGYNVIVVNSLKSEAKSSPLYFPVSLRQAQSLVAKARQQEWFGFSLPFLFMGLVRFLLWLR